MVVKAGEMPPNIEAFKSSSRNKGKTRDLGPCKTEGCEVPRKWYGSEYCKACRDRYKWRMAKRKRRARRSAGARANKRLSEERDIQAALARPLIRTRHKAYAEVAVAVASNERKNVLSREAMAFWYKWYNNPDNLCTTEALDRAGW